jgi:hypothetical protein
MLRLRRQAAGHRPRVNDHGREWTRVAGLRDLASLPRRDSELDIGYGVLMKRARNSVVSGKCILNPFNSLVSEMQDSIHWCDQPTVYSTYSVSTEQLVVLSGVVTALRIGVVLVCLK